jgi:general secretion pathway protein J
VIGRNNSGFTLIELMVSLVLLGLITTVVAAAVQSGILSSQSVEQTVDRAGQVRLAQSVLRRHLESARPARLADTEQPQTAFAGRVDGIKFIAVLPAWIGQGGTHKIKIGLSGGRLLLSTEVSPTNIETIDVRRPTSQTVLVDDVQAVGIAYFGRRGRERRPVWQDTWLERGRLPSLIRIRLKLTDDQISGWPDLVVAPKLDVAPR